MAQEGRPYLFLCVLGYVICCTLGATWFALLLGFTQPGGSLFVVFTDNIAALPTLIFLTAMISAVPFLFSRWFAGQFDRFTWISSVLVWVFTASVCGFYVAGLSVSRHAIGWMLIAGTFPGIFAGLIYYQFERPRYPSSEPKTLKAKV